MNGRLSSLKGRLKPGLSRLIGSILRSPLGALAERALVRLGHAFPHGLPARGVIAEQLIQRRAGADVVATLFNGLKMSAPSTREAFDMYFKGRSFSEDEGLTRLLLKLLREGDVFFDVGANLGFYTLIAASLCGSSGHVHAFEAQAALIKHLHRSIELNGYEGRVTVRHAAVAEEHGGQAELFFAHDKETLIGVPSLLRHEWLDGGAHEPVPVISLDGYVREQGVTRVNVVKLDIEGAELMALRGMRLMLERAAAEVLLVEMLPDALTFNSIGGGARLRPSPDASRWGELADLLEGYGYAPRRITPDGLLGPRYDGEQLKAVTRAVNVAFVHPALKAVRGNVFAES